MASSEIKHRARLRRDYRADQPVMGHESRLAQVFLNLLINGAHAIEEGSADENEILVSTYVDDDMVAIEVSDTGVGITDEQREMVWEPFRTTKPVNEGTGLGLAISRNIVRSLGGAIDFESTPGQGTTFRVELPIAQDASAPTDDDQDTTRIEGSLDILIIDDEAQLRRSVRRILEQRGSHRVVCVETAQAGLDLLNDGVHFDAIFCDLLMPQMTGMDFHEVVSERHADVLDRVVFMTGGAFTERMRSFADSAHVQVLTKPLDLDEVADVLESH